MYPFPSAYLKVLLTAPPDVRRARIIERDRRWGTRVIDRWENLEITRRQAEATDQQYNLVLDGTRPLSDNAAEIARLMSRS
jgi:thymidylate kinase